MGSIYILNRQLLLFCSQLKTFGRSRVAPGVFPIIFGSGSLTFWVQLIPCIFHVFVRVLWMLKLVFGAHNFYHNVYVGLNISHGKSINYLSQLLKR